MGNNHNCFIRAYVTHFYPARVNYMGKTFPSLISKLTISTGVSGIWLEKGTAASTICFILQLRDIKQRIKGAEEKWFAVFP